MALKHAAMFAAALVLGPGFTRIAAAATLAVAAPVGAATSAPVPGDCALKRLASYDVTVYSNATLSIPVDIAGSPRTMMLAPELPRSSVTPAVLPDLHNDPERMSEGLTSKAFMYQGTWVTSTVIIPQMNFGPQSLRNFKVYFAPRLPAPMEGVAAADMLFKFDVEFDLGHGKVNIFSPDHCDGQGLYWSHTAAVVPFTFASDGTPRIAMQLDGETVQAGFSTSSGIATMTLPSAHAIFGLDENSPGMGLLAASPNGYEKLYRYPFRVLSAGAFSVNDPTIHIFAGSGATRCDGTEHTMWALNLKESCLAPDLLLRLDLLSRLRVYFAVKEKKVYITGWNASLEPAQQTKTSP